MPTKPLNTNFWRYYLPSNKLPWNDPKQDSWSIVYVDDVGLLAVVSDHGNFSHMWGVSGRTQSDFRRELLRFGSSYVKEKLGYALADTYDGHATQKVVKEVLLNRRRSGSLSQEQAAADWEDAQDIDNVLTFSEFLDGRRGRWDLYLDCSSTKKHNQEGLNHWTQVSFPRLQNAIRQELQAESLTLATPAADTPASKHEPSEKA